MELPWRASLAVPLLVAILAVLRAGVVESSSRLLQQQQRDDLAVDTQFSRGPAQFGTSGEDNGRRPLCYSSPDDIGREISGSIENAPAPPPGETFSGEQLQRFPYVSAGYCRTFNQPLQLVPTDCELPGFDPQQFIEQFRGHRLIFWGDSVTRQFFFYMLLRLSRYSVPSIGEYAGTAAELPEADPINCRQHGSMSSDLHVDPACFELPPKDIADEQGCSYYDNTTAICYVRAERRLIDNRNVVYWNALKETDILFMNVGLHHNSKGMFKFQLAGFVRLAHYYKAKYHKLPLMLYRETSAQHFEGGEGGNFPGKSQELIDKLRDVDPDTFRCADHPYEVMKNTNWRNSFLSKPGFKDPSSRGSQHGVHMHFPIMRVWNTTAMGSNFHPRTLGGRTAESMEGATADCTHFCPSFGGIYEVWSTLLHNILRAGQPLQENLRPRFTTRSRHQFRTVVQSLSPATLR